MKKFELTTESKEFNGITLFRIKALVDFADVKSGYLGGWVEKEGNLSHQGNAWVFGNAWVHGDAVVSGNAQVYGNARVFGNARVLGDAVVSGNAWVHGDAVVSGNAQVYGNAVVSGNAWVHGDAVVYGDAEVYGDARVFGNAVVSSTDDWIAISSIGSENGVLTSFKNKDGTVIVNRGCFSGTIEQFEHAVNNRHGDNINGEIYRHVISILKLRLKK